MTLFLQELSKRFSDYFLLVIYDGAPCHSEGALTLPEHMKVVSLPPYSPELNPQENNWDDMREKFFKNTVFNSMQAVEDQLVLAYIVAFLIDRSFSLDLVPSQHQEG